MPPVEGSARKVEAFDVYSIPHGNVSLDADPVAPGVQIAAATVDEFLKMPSADIGRFLGGLDEPSHTSLKRAVDQHAALQPSGNRLTFRDRLFAGAMATPSVQPERPINHINRRFIDGHLQLDLRYDGGIVHYRMPVPDGFIAHVRDDNTVMLRRTDGRPFRPPYHANDRENVDHVLFYPELTRNDTIFKYNAGDDAGTVDLWPYMQSLRG